MPPMALHRRPRPQVVETAHMPAPVGGINTIAAGSAMPSEDCVYLYNMIASEFGLRSRLGYAEYVTGLNGEEVRTMVPFSGSHSNTSTDAQFACTPTGIWDTTDTTASPTKPVTFSTVSGTSGYGISTVMATPAGRFLLHCDEENGLYVYTENSGTWAKAVSGTTVLWAPTTVYESGDKVANGADVYACTVGGTSAGSGGPTGTGTGITDGTVTWNYSAPYVATAIGPSLADQRLGYTADPANFAFVCVWKNRVWYVEKDTSRAWYGGVNAIRGTFTSFDFGSKMSHGGPLVGLYNWSYDGGSGMDTLMVGLSTAGDVVIYQGTDPTQATTFGLKGAWFVGGVPSGRRIATDYGGDILILSLIGVLPLSKLVIGNPAVDRSQYATAKIANLFNVLADTYRDLPGWSLHVHPTDNALLLTVPQAPGQPTTQLAYSFSTKGWSQYRDLPMLSAGVWNGTLYFGTVDGRVCQNTGYVDNVQLSNPSLFNPVAWSLLTAYQNLGNARNKQVRMLRPTVVSQTPVPTVQATARYGFQLDEPTPPSIAPLTASSGTWDNIYWDVDAWSGATSPTQQLGGARGIGRDVAIAVQGVANSRTTLVGVDIVFEQGGLL